MWGSPGWEQRRAGQRYGHEQSAGAFFQFVVDKPARRVHRRVIEM